MDAEWAKLLGKRPAAVATAANTARKGHKRNRTNNLDKKSTQLCIDLGQKNFNRRVDCPICKMNYAIDSEEEKLNHKRFCQNHQRGPNMTSIDAENVVVAKTRLGHRIICIDEYSTPLVRKRLHAAKKLMEQDLGDFEIAERYKAFLCINSDDKKLMGCAIAHPLNVAHRVCPNSSPVQHEAEESRSACGVSHIWVHKTCRRLGVASEILEAIRCHMWSTFELKRDDIAFCQPTENGCRLAASFCGSERYLVYRFYEVAK